MNSPTYTRCSANYLEDAQIKSHFSNYLVSLAVMNYFRANKNRPIIQYCQGKSQPGASVGMTKHRAFNIKIMTFQITKHLIEPHSAVIGLQSHLPIWKVGHQLPWFVSTGFPMRQPSFNLPNTLTRLLHPTSQITPCNLSKKTDERPSFLSEHVFTTLGIQLFCYFDCPKFTVIHGQNS